MSSIRTFSDSQYSILVLQTLKRLLRRSDYYLAVLPPRDILSKDEASASDVSLALDFAIESIRGQFEAQEVAKPPREERKLY
jgi:hypothetical protein